MKCKVSLHFDKNEIGKNYGKKYADAFITLAFTDCNV